MKKLLKTFLILLLITLSIFIPLSQYVNALPTDLKVFENSADQLKLPRYFRKTTDLSTLNSNPKVNLKGLNSLNISGSEQFSYNGLNFIKESIGNNFLIMDIDLREESHGFVNGIAISFQNESNNANSDLTLPEIIDVENDLLSSIPLNTPLLLSNTNRTIIPTTISNENDLTRENKIIYLRIPVTDNSLPTDDMVDYFLSKTSTLPNNSWLHFHCDAGIGRTTLFMIMYDIINNCNDVSLDDIITRQVLLAKLQETEANSFFKERRYDFLKNFYNNQKNK